jgi:hypothetical protein
MIEKKTVLNQIEIRSTGEIGLQFGLVLLDDGAEIARDWHRTVIEPGINPRAQIAAVNAHFQAGIRKAGGSVIKPNPIDEADIARIVTIVSTIHTPEVVNNYRRDREERSSRTNTA